LWLEDPDQLLQEKSLVSMDGFVTYRARTNYRTPESIARFIQNTLPFDFNIGNDLPGLGVGVHSYHDPSEQPKIVTKQITELMRQGFSIDDVAIVTCGGIARSAFTELAEVGSAKLRKFTGEYTPTGEQIVTDGMLRFDSVSRFKGLEAPAVILVDVDPYANRMEIAERMIYCGMTRATVRLEMVVNAENPYNQRFTDSRS
jgi:superfamily I DNA and RNA helicase